MYPSRTCFLFFPSLQCEDIHTDTQIHSLFIFTMVQTFITWLHHKGFSYSPWDIEVVNTILLNYNGFQRDLDI